MKLNWYKILLYTLRSLVYVKRGIFGILGFVWKGVLKVNGIYQVTLGFVLFKAIFYIKKHVKKLSFSQQESRLEFFGRRGTLQILLFIVMGIIMFPHSRLYTKGYDDIAGRDTILYKIVGPGNQNFDEGLEEVMADTVIVDARNVDVWKRNALVADPSVGDESVQKEPQELAGTSAGGSALTKPIIISGADMSGLVDTSGTDTPQKTGRTEIVYYEVQPGDAIETIAKNFGVSKYTILWANDLSERAYIRPGDKFAILPVDGLIHTVVQGETVLKIASKYDTTAEKIIAFNKLQKDGADIVVGEELIIPDGVKPQPVYTAPTYIVQRPTSFDTVVAPPPSVSAPAGSGYLWPAASTIITQYYDWRHNGIDIGGKMGTSIYATKSGTVKVSQCGWNGGYGCYVVLDHGNGVESRYGHNSQLLVNVGDYVNQGQPIALMGNTGNVRGRTGIHLHFEIKFGGKNVNPLSYVRK